MPWVPAVGAGIQASEQGSLALFHFFTEEGEGEKLF